MRCLFGDFGLFLLYIRRPFCIPFASYKSTVFIPMSRNVRMPTSRPKSCKLQSPLRTNDVSSGMVSSFLNCAKLKGCLSVVGMGGFSPLRTARVECG